MQRIVLLAACLAMPMFDARTASFDCTKATSAVEKAICTDPALLRADDQMAED